MRTVAVAVLVACRTGTSSSGSTSDTPTGSATAAPRTWIEPSVQIHGERPDQAIDSDLVVLPAHGDDPGTLFVHATAAVPEFVALSGALPPGEYTVGEAWDQFSGVTFDQEFVLAGDTDGDGHLDVWDASRGRLYRGPFVPGQVRYDDSVAELDGAAPPAFGDFDADGDGTIDLLTSSGVVGQVFYGPFAGTVAVDSAVTRLEADGGCLFGGASRIRDYGGPGQDAVGVGGGSFDCGGTASVFRLMGPRGRQLGRDDAVAVGAAYDGTWGFDSADVDGDGTTEVLFGVARGREVFRNPLERSVLDTPKVWDPSDAIVADPAGDVNGDGLTDIVIWILDAGDPESWYGLLLAPVDLTRPPAETAIPLTPECVPGATFCWSHIGEFAMDLDGDGLSDLVAAEGGPDHAGHVAIWYGADLLAAAEGRR